MKRISFSRVSEWAVLLVLVFAIFWRGGKGIEAQFLTAAVAVCVTLLYAVKKILRIRHSASEQPMEHSIVRRKAEVPFTLWIIVLALLGWTILSYVFSHTRNYGLDEVVRAAALSLLFFWTVRMALEEQRGHVFYAFVRVVAYCAIAGAIIGVFVYVFQPVTRFVGTFFFYRYQTDYWPNAWGEFVLLAWPMVFIEYYREQRVWLARLLLAGLSLLIGSLFLSYSRGSILVFCGQLVFAIILFTYFFLSDIRYRRSLRALRRNIIVRAGMMGCAAILLFIGLNQMRSQFHAVQSVVEKVTFTASEGTSSIDERKQFWLQALRLSEERPFFGWGPYSFRFIQPHIAPSVLATSDHPHNVILKLAVESGWPAALLFLLLLGLVVGSSLVRLCTARREWSQERDVAVGMLNVAVVGVFVHNLIDFNLQFIAIVLPFWMMLAFLVLPAASMHESAASFYKWKRARNLFWLKIALAVALLFVVLDEGMYLVITSLGRHAQASGDANQALHYYAYADEQWFSRDLFLSEAQLMIDKGQFAAAAHALDVYETQNQEDARLWAIRGDLLLRMNQPSKARIALERAYAYGKYTDLGILHALLLADKASHDSAAQAHKYEYDKLFTEYADAIERNVHFIALSQNPEQLMAVARDLGNFFPTDSQRYAVIARKAFAHAVEERAQSAARRPGMLW
jgi:O-antigen ligase